MINLLYPSAMREKGGGGGYSQPLSPYFPYTPYMLLGVEDSPLRI